MEPEKWSVEVVCGDRDIAALLEELIALSDDFVVVDRGTGAPHAVVIDVSDRDLFGLELVGHLKRQRPTAHVVAFAPLPDPVSLISSLDAGVDAYLATSQLWSELVPTLQALRNERPTADEPMAALSSQ